MLSFSLGVGKFLLRLLRWNFKYKITLNAAETLPTNYSHIKPNNSNRHTQGRTHAWQVVYKIHEVQNM